MIEIMVCRWDRAPHNQLHCQQASVVRSMFVCAAASVLTKKSRLE